MVTETLYDRQAELQLKIPPICTVVGCGGTGTWTAIFLAMSGVKELILIDEDRITPSNLNRLPYMRGEVDSYKCTALADTIKRLRPSAIVTCLPKTITCEEDCTWLYGDIYCCTDTLKSQQLVAAFAKKNSMNYQRIGYDGTVLNVSTAFPLTFDEIEDTGGYTQTPSWVVPAALAAACGVASKMYKPLCLMEDIGKLVIQDSSFVTSELKTSIQSEMIADGTIRRNIQEDMLRAGYGDCSVCGRVDLDDGYGYCDDCERVCEEAQEARDEGYADGQEDVQREVLDAITEGHHFSNALQEALETYYQTRKERKNE